MASVQEVFEAEQLLRELAQEVDRRMFKGEVSFKTGEVVAAGLHRAAEGLKAARKRVESQQ